MDKKTLTEVLRRGILEIRALSSGKNGENIERIHVLANILHNIPLALSEESQKLNRELLFNELVKYEEVYGDSSSWLSEVLNPTTDLV